MLTPPPLKKPRIMALDSDSPVAEIANDRLPIPTNQFELPPLNFNSTSLNSEIIPSVRELLSQAQDRSQFQAHISPSRRAFIQPQPAQFQIIPIHSLIADDDHGFPIQQDSFNKAKIIESSNKAYNALICLTSKDPENKSKASAVINQVKQISDYGEAILNQYLTQNEFDKVYNFLFILSFFNKDFKKIVRVNNDRHIVSAKNTTNVIHYIVENLHDKLLPLLNVFASDNLSTMLYLYDTDKAKTTLDDLCELIKEDPFQDLKTIFPREKTGSFLSKIANNIQYPNKILKDILINVENIKLIDQEGFNDTQISRIFSSSGYNFENQVKSFVKHINLIKGLIGDNDDKKNFFSLFLSKISKDFNNLIPLFCKIDFFEAFETLDIKSINQSKVFGKLKDMKGQFKITDEFLKSFEILIAPKTSYSSSAKKRSLQPPDSHLKDSDSGFASFEPLALPLSSSPASASISVQPFARIADPISAPTFTFFESFNPKSSRGETVKNAQPILKALITADKRLNPNLIASLRNNDPSLAIEAPSSNPIPSEILACPASKNPNAVGAGGVAL